MKRFALTLISLTLFTTSLPSFAQKLNQFREQQVPSSEMMIADAVVGRPLGLATTVVGSALFVVTLPFSILGGNSGEAAKRLVADPAAETFERCLGCKVGERRR